MKIRIRLTGYQMNWGYLALGALGGCSLGALIFWTGELLAKILQTSH